MNISAQSYFITPGASPGLLQGLGPRLLQALAPGLLQAIASGPPESADTGRKPGADGARQKPRRVESDMSSEAEMVFLTPGASPGFEQTGARVRQQ